MTGADGDERAEATPNTGLRRRLGTLLRTPIGFTVALLAVVWAVMPLMPEGSGLNFPTAFQAFFSVIILFAGAFFWFLDLGPIRQPQSGFAVVASIGLVYLVTVGVLVGAGTAYLQFSIPQKEGQAQEHAELTLAEQGEELFKGGEFNCVLCHAIDGRGGTRAPDMSGFATRAGTRVPGVSAEEYTEGHIKEGSQYSFNVPEYQPIMPPFGARLSDEQLAALVEFLLTLE